MVNLIRITPGLNYNINSIKYFSGIDGSHPAQHCDNMPCKYSPLRVRTLLYLYLNCIKVHFVVLGKTF